MGHAIRRSVALPDGSRVSYALSGAGRDPVVLLHGGTGSLIDWDPAAAILARRHQVVAIDMLGFGRSDRPPGRYTPWRLADSVLRAMDGAGAERAHLVGHSLGGRVAIEIALTRPERTGRMAVIAPMGFGRLSAAGFALGFAHWGMHRATLRTLPYPDLDVRLDDARLRAGAPVGAPTKVIWGEGDMFFPARYAARAVAAMPGASAEIVEAAGHAPHRQFPERVAASLLEFLAGGAP